MPELPEVETIARDLRAAIMGVKIEDCLARPLAMRHWPQTKTMARQVRGRHISRVERRGKYIQVGLEEGKWILVHLGMSGRLSLVKRGTEEAKHTHVIWELENGMELRYSDARRFGHLAVGGEQDLEAEEVWAKLGPEANLAGFDLYERLAGKRVAIKSALLDQKVLAGVGNIYADEALWRARIRPERPAGEVTKREARKLQEAIMEVLNEAIENRGSSIEGYRDAQGERGKQQEYLAVYGRAGEACERCRRSLSTKRIGGRSSVFCEHCQR